MPQEMQTSAKIAKALREFNAKYGKYIDAIPEMALSHASNVVAVPAGMGAFFWRGQPEFGR